MPMGQPPRERSALSRSLADEIRARRRAIEMSQDELGKLARISRGQVNRIEAGDRVIDVSQLERIANALDTTMIDLMLGAEARVSAEKEDPASEGHASSG